MTGREYILYLLSNNLEDSQIYENGRLLGFMTVMEAAAKFNVGAATIIAWYEHKLLDGIIIGNTLFIPTNAKHPFKGGKNAQTS